MSNRRGDLGVFICRKIAALGLLCATACASHARTDCLVETKGEYTITWYCVEDYTCNIPEWKCDPGPAALARQEKNKWSGDKNDCDSAGEFERQTAAWYYACVLDTNMIRKSSYTPKIDPAQMSRRAKEGCRGQSDFDKCVGDAKQQMILEADPSIREACSLSKGVGFVECVDRLYVYGPDPPKRSPILRDKLFALGKAQRDEGPAGDRSKVDTGPKPKRCPPGYGMKPDREAFGAWTCQPLGVVFFGHNRGLPAGRNPPDQREAAEAIEAFEARHDRVALDAVESALNGHEQNLSEAERDQCMSEAFAAVQAVFKGGVPEVSSTCRAIAGAAREELAYYACNHADTSDASLEELFRGLCERTQPAIKERQNDCLSDKLPPDELRKCLLGSVER